MPKIFSHFLLSPKDLGIEHYSINEIAEMMKPTDNIDDSALHNFARTVSLSLGNDSHTLDNKES